MRPAEQCLDRRDAPVAQVELRLVVRLEMVLLGGDPQLFDEAQQVAVVVEVLVVELEGDVAELGAVLRDVGAAQQARVLTGVRGHEGDAWPVAFVLISLAATSSAASTP